MRSLSPRAISSYVNDMMDRLPITKRYLPAVVWNYKSILFMDALILSSRVGL